mmetsp:Transcript_12737/g.36565  ORF Transcript_12737/g.36565 Transcript_12737/m.36565 type:complete len:314 (-) Transcript_12737:106-1047(-)
MVATCFWMSILAATRASCAFFAAASTSLIVALPSSLLRSSGGLSNTAFALSATFMTSSSIAASCLCKASTAFFASLILASVTFGGCDGGVGVFATAAARADFGGAPAGWVGACNFFNSAAMEASNERNFGDERRSALTTLCPAGPAAFASRASEARAVCVLVISSCACCKPLRTRATSPPAANEDLAPSIASLVVFSAVATWSITALSLALQLDSPTLEAALDDAGADDDLTAALGPAAEDALKVIVKMPGLGSWSQGTRHLSAGGDMLCDWHNAHTWEPPTWSPNHQPEFSSPSRSSQKYKNTLSSAFGFFW